MLTARQQHILGLIVGDYITLASPISSESIARNHELGVSPATIRNDVAHLEDEGYITRPHLSAGSVPLDNAYRLYVEAMLQRGHDRIHPAVQSSVRRQLTDAEPDVESWTAIAATLLARLVGNLAIATFPRARQSRVRHLEIVYLQDLLYMLIVVLEQARLRRHLIRLSEPIFQAEMDASANKVRVRLVGLTREEIGEMETSSLSALEEDVVQATAMILSEEDRGAYRDHYVDGLRNLLSQPEFSESQRMRALVEGVEDGTLVSEVLSESPDTGMVRVVIGQEHRGDLLWPLSVVLCRYGIPGEAVGVVGAVGPTRMEYSRTIASVRLMSSTMSELVEGVRSA